jgi:hypothetical protein
MHVKSLFITTLTLVYFCPIFSMSTQSSTLYDQFKERVSNFSENLEKAAIINVYEHEITSIQESLEGCGNRLPQKKADSICRMVDDLICFLEGLHQKMAIIAIRRELCQFKTLILTSIDQEASDE